MVGQLVYSVNNFFAKRAADSLTPAVGTEKKTAPKKLKAARGGKTAAQRSITMAHASVPALRI